jgi:hypothetical protein
MKCIFVPLLPAPTFLVIFFQYHYLPRSLALAALAMQHSYKLEGAVGHRFPMLPITLCDHVDDYGANGDETALT